MTVSIDGTTGELPKGRIAIVASRYNASICDALVEGALLTLHEAGYGQADTPVIRVPGLGNCQRSSKQLFSVPT